MAKPRKTPIMLICLKCKNVWKSSMTLPIGINELRTAFVGQKCTKCNNHDPGSIGIKP